ncbi:DUF2955 domain-containing protein [Alteromonas gilva]|uniref:DUF2955 domain-containing protein n=1 Tax=Alteromonas gilva TaxID=2987522 RepID=A0ABT5L1A9_9ALTE|nr:DUF2955 domain-containing protein [Alteromonas gilva]MDC8830815.1 DUF2955 domain-containing protein [Alteromonas gilva]
MSTKAAVPSLSGYEYRRVIRIALGSCLGFTISKLMGWPYGVFFAVYPILLLGMAPVFNLKIALEFCLSVLINVVEIWLLKTFFTPFPLLMTLAVFAVFCLHFRNMAKGNNIMMWTSGVVTLAVMLHFGSYPTTSLTDMTVSTLLATVISVAGGAVLFWLLPDNEAPAMPARPPLSVAQINHRMLMGATLATLSFVVFQVFNLRDSLSAQVATILVLFPMTYSASLMNAWNRVRGVAMGCTLALISQLLMYNLISHLVLVVMAMFMTLLLAARIHMLERIGSGVGFGALTTIGILYGQYLQPNADFLYSSFYRLASVVVALIILMMTAYFLDSALNKISWAKDVA